MSLLSVVVPCYNEEETVADFYAEFIKNDLYFQENNIQIEILYINDGSKDKTSAEVKKLIEKDSRVHLISFSRNFGKEAAMYAGLQKAKGDYVFFCDADDTVREDFLLKPYRRLEETKADLCFFTYAGGADLIVDAGDGAE